MGIARSDLTSKRAIDQTWGVWRAGGVYPKGAPLWNLYGGADDGAYNPEPKPSS